MVTLVLDGHSTGPTWSGQLNGLPSLVAGEQNSSQDQEEQQRYGRHQLARAVAYLHLIWCSIQFKLEYQKS